MSKKLSRLLAVGALAAIALVYPLLAPTPHRIDDQHFELIVAGMTEADVEAIFGAPPGRYDWAVHEYEWFLSMIVKWADEQTSPTTMQFPVPRFVDEEIPPLIIAASADGRGGLALEAVLASNTDFRAIQLWISRHGMFVVALDEQGRVVRTLRWGQTRIEPPWDRWWSQAWRAARR